MSTLVSPQPTIISDSGSLPGGILLNTRSVSTPLQSEYSSPLASSSSLLPQPHDSQPRSRSSTFGDAGTRKIRFAPLPDPRRKDFAPVFDPEESESDSAGHLLRHSSAPPFSPPSPAHSLKEAEQHSDEALPRCKPKTKHWSQKLLRPFQPLLSNKSSDEGIHHAYSYSTAKVNGNGNGDSANGYKDGAPLGHFMSANCASTSREIERSHEYRDGGPLMHVLSESGGSSSRGRRDGQRMLNGHVYGKRAVPADCETTSSEPEFVEWGYGGMGSVRNNHPRVMGGTVGPDWAKVQRGGTLGDVEGGQDDDGSGMGWVKRRREKRELEKRLRETRDETQKDQATRPTEDSPTEYKAAEEREHLARKSESDSDTWRRDEEHLIYRAVSVPAPHHHSRYHSYHKGGETSGTVTPTSAPSLSRNNSLGSVPKAKQDVVTRAAIAESEKSGGSGSSVSSLASKTSSESLEDEDDDDHSTERESDDDNDIVEENRVTSKSAGVEKISRHKE